MPISSTHSFYCKNLGLEAKFTALGADLGACISIFTSDDPYASRISIYIDDVQYAERLADAINYVGKQTFVDEEAA